MAFSHEWVETDFFKKKYEKYLKDVNVRDKCPCFVGTKGVGKSTLLMQLYLKKKELEGENGKNVHYVQLNRMEEADWSRLHEWVVEAREQKETIWLFIDNIQLAIDHPFGTIMLRCYVKQTSHHPECRIVAASSRAGLLTLMCSHVKLNASDFDVVVVPAEPEVGTKLLKQELPKTTYENNREAIESGAVYFGHVPLFLIEMAHKINTDNKGDVAAVIRLFKMEKLVGLVGFLEEDKEVMEKTRSTRALSFTKALAFAAVGPLSVADLYTTVWLEKADLPWTLLSMTDDDEICSASEAATEAMAQFVQNDDQLAESVMLQIESMDQSSGQFLGRCFGRWIHRALCLHTSFTYILSGSGEVQVSFANIKDGGEKRMQTLNEDELEPNNCYFVPCMEGVDVIIKVADSELFLIQATVGDVTKKKQFWDMKCTTTSNTTHLLVVPDDSIATELEQSKSQIAVEYREQKFGIVKVDTVLEPSHTKILRGYLGRKARKFKQIKK